MSKFSDLLGLAEDKLAEVFHRKPFDPSKERKALIKRLEKAQQQYASATPVKGRKLFSIGNEGVVRFNSPVEIDGKTEFYFSSANFPAFVTKLVEKVGLGEFDAQLEKNGDKPPATSTAPKQTRRGWSPERRAAFAAKKAQK